MCVDDLVENEVLVVKEKLSDKPASAWSGDAIANRDLSYRSHDQPHDQYQRSHEQQCQSRDQYHRSHDQAHGGHMTAVVPSGKAGPMNRSRNVGVANSAPSYGTVGARNVGVANSASSYGTVGAPVLSHFIQCNSFGYYFLAEAENVRLVQSQGRTRKAHCIVKVPHIQGTCVWGWCTYSRASINE